MASRYRIGRQRRIRRPKKQRKGGLWARVVRAGRGALSVATAASLVFLGYTLYRYFQHSGQLHIGEVKIMGCMNIAESELLDLAKVDFRANLLSLDLQEVSRHLARHPWVEKARVRRDFSGKALIIEVQERVPRALILLDELYLMDRNGEVFKKADFKERMDLPILTGVTPQEWKEKDPRTLELLRQALELLEHLEGRKVFSLRDVSEVHLGRKMELTLYTLREGIPIRLGSGDYADKLNRLEKVLPDLRGKMKNVESLALNYPKKVVVKMKETKSERPPKS
ncbi:MAG: FtsQ-type POTRA domain-containing protein [Syntrophaceae bacterium]|nr:FtsQ-type POTRA domain-containing protein [Syntrophaceae bacterium]